MRRLAIGLVTLLSTVALGGGVATASTWSYTAGTSYAVLYVDTATTVDIAPRAGADAAAVTLASGAWTAGDSHPDLRIEGSTLVIGAGLPITALFILPTDGTAIGVRVHGSSTAWRFDLQLGADTLRLLADGGSGLDLGGHDLIGNADTSTHVDAAIAAADVVQLSGAPVVLARDVRFAGRRFEVPGVIGAGRALDVTGDLVLGPASGLRSLSASGSALIAGDLSVTESATFGSLQVSEGVTATVAATSTVIRGGTTVAPSYAACDADPGGPGSCSGGGAASFIGDVRFGGPVTLRALTAVGGRATLTADVTTTGPQTYDGDVTVVLAGSPITLAAAGGAEVALRATVTATWPAVPGAIGYTARIAPSAKSCTWAGGPLSCAFGAVPAAASQVFSVDVARPSATETVETATTTARRLTVRRRSRTALSRVVAPPAVTGRRIWSERGPCAIRAGTLVAPKRRGTCTVTLRVKRGTTVAWTGRTIVSVR